MDIRPIQRSDLKQYTELRIRPRGTEHFTPRDRTSDEDDAWWDTFIATGVAKFWSAFVDGQMVGSLCLFSFDEYGPNTAEIGVEVFDPANYGKGYATQMLDFGTERALDLGVTELVARIVEDNHGSTALFQKLGFKFEGASTTNGDPSYVLNRFHLSIH